MSLDEARKQILGCDTSVAIWVFDRIAPTLIPEVGRRANSSKKINDPIWRTIHIEPNEVAILDTPLMQRLRRIRQLGLANMVYPGANHTRFDHSIGVLAAIDKMLKRILETLPVPDEISRRLRSTARMAALLHDVGHGSFSHVSDRVLNNVYREDFVKIGRALQGIFPPVQSGGATIDVSLPPAAEIISLLLLLSPQFEKMCRSICIDVEDIRCSMAWILGRSYGLRHGNAEYVFIKSLVSGDLDADKVDYVARDAYFAGIPIAADVDRLVSQLHAVRFSQRTHDSGSETIDRYFMGVLPSGVPAVEMFVITRSYIADRIYRHPKIRAAERHLEETLETYLTSGGAEAFESILLNGDDWFLCDRALPSRFLSLATREVTTRAIGISRSRMYGYSASDGLSLSSLTSIWTDAKERIQANREEIEKSIRQIADLRVEDNVTLDSRSYNPIKENPEVYVQPYLGPAPRRVNEFFDANKYANAYQDVKDIMWIFCDERNKLEVATAATLCLYMYFGLIPTRDAYVIAKVSPDDVDVKLREYYDRFSDAESNSIRASIDDILYARGQHAFLPLAWIRRSCPASWAKEAKDTFSSKLSQLIAKLALPQSYTRDLDCVLGALEILLRHRDAEESSAKLHRKMDESEFESSLLRFLQQDKNFNMDYSPSKQEWHPAGRTDIVLRPATGRKIVIELKCSERSFETSVSEWAGQALQYAASGEFNRIAILYCVYKDDEPTRSTDVVDLRLNSQFESSKLAAVCIGLRLTSGAASVIAAHTKAKQID